MENQAQKPECEREGGRRDDDEEEEEEKQSTTNLLKERETTNRNPFSLSIAFKPYSNLVSSISLSIFLDIYIVYFFSSL